MAKNLIEQFLDYAAAKLAGPIAQEPIYREESTKMTGVAKYLAQQEMAARAQEAAIAASATTGVAKYLARQAALAAANEEAPAAPAAEQVPLTGVARYLAGQQQAAKPAAAPAPEPKTGVAKYMASLLNEDVKKKSIIEATPHHGAVVTEASLQTPAVVAEAPAQEPEVAAAPDAVVAEASEHAPTFHDLEQEIVVSTEHHAPDSAIAIESIIHLNDGKQCQASTTKGAQCKHTSNLGYIQRTIDQKKYMFSVCHLHHNDAFKPYPAVLATQ